MAERILEERNRAVRHGLVELLEHWTIALSGLLLLLSGMFELPLAGRYAIDKLPGMAWSGDFISSLSIHYVASVVFIAAAVFHVVYHGIRGDFALLPRRGDLKASWQVILSFFGKGEEPPFHKYLPEQRLAYLGMAVIIAGLIISGLVKTYKNLYAPDMSLTILLWATWTHNVFFMLFILAFLAHIGAILLKPNRPMFRGILTGKIRLDYARHRHPLWIAELEPSRPVEPAAAAAPLPAEPPEDEPEAESLPGTKETMESTPPPVSQPESGDSGRNP
ncbi:MAG TPA: cytochrome b/b6 domain-containing protein [Syntrophales bacterium]|nr:cytochrome b/b6 domain-containing protein [Syntrophales bacterium]